jgi:hypothetical protein
MNQTGTKKTISTYASSLLQPHSNIRITLTKTDNRSSKAREEQTNITNYYRSSTKSGKLIV